MQESAPITFRVSQGNTPYNFQFLLHWRSDLNKTLIYETGPHSGKSLYDHGESSFRIPENIWEIEIRAETLEEIITLLGTGFQKSMNDETLHIHRGANDHPFVCWAHPMETIAEAKTILRIWLELNLYQFFCEENFDFNKVSDLEEIRELLIRNSLKIEEINS